MSIIAPKVEDAPSVARRWLIVVAGIAALIVLLVGSGSGAPDTAVAAGTPGPTLTPTFQWVVPDSAQPRNRLHVDPFDRRFQVDYLDENGRPVQGTPISLPSMHITNRQVNFAYTQSNRICETATPDPTGNGPAVTATPARCPMYVWAMLDRQRKQVRATIFRRTVSGHMVSSVINRATPLALPVAPDPAVVIQNFQMVPKRRIIQPTDQVTFQNNTTLPCTIQFNSQHPPGQPPANPDAFDLGVISPGRLATPFPPLLPTPTPTLAAGATPTPRPDIWRSGEHLYTGSCGNIQISGSIVVP